MGSVETTILFKKNNDVATVQETDRVVDAARVMLERRIGSVVIQCEGRVVGIFTERDIAYRVVAAGRDPQATLVRDVMTSPVETCSPGTPLEECATIMTQRRLRHLPIVQNGKLLGMLTSGDILASQISDQLQTIDYLQEYLHGQRA